MENIQPEPERPRYTHWFKKGQSGNPAGRPKGKSLTHTLREMLEKEINLNNHPITGEVNVRLTMKEVIILAMMKKALRGDMEAIKTILERIDGKIPLPLEHSGITVQLAAMVEYIKDPTKLMENIISVNPEENGNQVSGT